MRSPDRTLALILLAALVAILVLKHRPTVAIDVMLSPMAHLPMVRTFATPTPTPTPKPATSGDVRITKIFYDGVQSQEPGEYVEIKNFDSKTIQLHNWTLRDVANHVCTFPSFLMQPGTVCRIYTNEWHSSYCNFNYQSGSAIRNNGGDCVYLRNSGGSQIDRYCY